MGVATHLGIALSEYDARIRSFIPDYERMLEAGASVVPPSARTIVDLGVGTGAFAAACALRAPQARVFGIDADQAIVAIAMRRLGPRAMFGIGPFRSTPIPRADAVIASLALHHVRGRGTKLSLYRRVHRALRPRGRFVIVDCQPASARALRNAQFDEWRAHLRRRYSAVETRRYLQAWSREDTYVPLDAEMALLTRARFRVDVVWRKGPFAVLLASK